MLPRESADAGGLAIWTRARYFARLSACESRFFAFSPLAVSRSRQHSTVFTCILLVRVANNSYSQQCLSVETGQAPSLLITAAKLPGEQDRKSPPGKRARPGCARECL